MKTLQHGQTKGLQELFRLPVLQASPYFSIGRGAVRKVPMLNKIAVVTGYRFDNPTFVAAEVQFLDTSTFAVTDAEVLDLTLTTGSAADIYAATVSAIAAYAILASYTIVSTTIVATPNAAPSSYQTIVSQTGTAAPAVSGSLSPASTYPSGTTFTWARTGAGVYTLTASTAVFNTSGKTGVFVGSLNNLNASCKTVVTSSTVITITTAIGSLLGLGLLGLTATNTDALLSQTMIYVQTYA